MSTRIQAVVGERVTLPDLAETGGTGYLWSIAEQPDGLRVVSSEHREPGNAAPGASGTRRFVVEPARPGIHTVVVELRRPWESDAREQRTFEIEARVP